MSIVIDKVRICFADERHSCRTRSRDRHMTAPPYVFLHVVGRSASTNNVAARWSSANIPVIYFFFLFSSSPSFCGLADNVCVWPWSVWTANYVHWLQRGGWHAIETQLVEIFFLCLEESIDLSWIQTREGLHGHVYLYSIHDSVLRCQRSSGPRWQLHIGKQNYPRSCNLRKQITLGNVTC